MSPRTYEEEPQVSDYRRSVSSYDSTAAVDDHELTLSTPAILGLFFALVIVCGCFFGLGYAMGHRTAPATPPVFDTATAPASGAAKPVAGSVVPADATPADNSAPAAVVAALSGPQTATVPLASATASSAPATAPVADGAAVRTAPAAANAASQAGAVAPGTFIVQVAAVSSQDVANILLTTLQKKGYNVAVRQEPQDKLLHVQIGPFADRKDAEAMRQRVLADGFNAIVK